MDMLPWTPRLGGGAVTDGPLSAFLFSPFFLGGGMGYTLLFLMITVKF